MVTISYDIVSKVVENIKIGGCSKEWVSGFSGLFGVGVCGG